MSEQIIVFKNGERVITELQEVFEGEGDDRKGICLMMNNPYILELIEMDDGALRDLQVKFSKWCPYSVDFQFRVPYDTVLALGEPDSGLAEAYRQKVAAITGNPDAPEGVPDLPEWTDGAENPNISAQQADIDAVVNGFEGNGAPVDESVGS
jgi:hypothetical protein